MAKKTLLSALLCSGAALLTGAIFATTLPAAVDLANSTALDSKTAKLHKSGFVNNKGGSYQINKHFAIEGGYTAVGLGSDIQKTNIQKKQMTQFAAKAILPFKNGFNIFGKAGMANISNTDDNASNQNSWNNYNKILPYYGGGLGYNATSNSSFDVQLAGTPKSGALPAINSTTVGFVYDF